MRRVDRAIERSRGLGPAAEREQQPTLAELHARVDLPGRGVRSALEMVHELPAAGLPPVHVGLSSGPVIFQEGDYFGSTVNLSSRVADYARPGEVLVSKAVADASGEQPLAFGEIGPVELKGVAGTVHLLRAQPA